MNDDQILFAWMTQDGLWVSKDSDGCWGTTPCLEEAYVCMGDLPDHVKRIRPNLLRLRVRVKSIVRIHEDQSHD